MPKKNTDIKLIFSLSEEVLDEESVFETLSDLLLENIKEEMRIKELKEANKKLTNKEVISPTTKIGTDNGKQK